MNNYTIRPIQKLIRRTSGAHVPQTELAAIVRQVQKTKTQKEASPEQKASVVLEDEYLKILTMLDEAFAGQKHLAKSRIIELVDQYIRENNLYYQAVRHETEYRNYFYSPEESEQFYDIAFYNPLASQENEGHHTHAGMTDIFYARLEEKDDTVLIGNLQIDDSLKANPWADSAREKIMLARKNLYQSMVQETLKHALKTGKPKIMFQTGDAALIAQRDRQNETWHTVDMQGETYRRYQALYEGACREFDAVAVGENSIVPHRHFDYGLVIEKQPDYYRSYHQYAAPDGSKLMELVGHHFHSGAGRAQKDKFYEFRNPLQRDIKQSNACAVLETVNGIFKLLEPNYVEQSREEKLKYLDEQFSEQPTHQEPYPGIRPEDEILDKFLIKFNYHKIFLAQHPSLETMVLPPHMQEKYRSSALRFYDPNAKDSIVTFYRKHIEPPVPGKIYVLHERDLGRPLIKNQRYTDEMEVIFYYYEKILPETFARLGLKFKRVEITRNSYGVPMKSTAWLITDGLDKLQDEALASFAHGPRLKADCETLPRLEVALKKFGLPPEKLTVVNDWLTEPSKNCLGSYHPDRDEIRLSTASLSLAAHEGLHRLIKKGLVPAHEYRSLVSAGRRLAAAKPQAWQQRQSPGAHAAAPREEYAAWFVESYYENHRTARKYLMGAKVPVFERLLGYIKEVWDVLATAVGSDPARARQFLRRVERNQIMSPPRERARRAEYNNAYSS